MPGEHAHDVTSHLRQVRESRGISQEDLAAQLGIHRSTLSRFETGKQPIPHPIIVQAIRVLQCTFHELFPS